MNPKEQPISQELTPNQPKPLNTTRDEVGKPGVWDRFSGWFVINVLSYFYKYIE